MSEAEHYEVDGYIIRNVYMGDVPYPGSRISRLMQAVLTRLNEVERLTADGQHGWHAIVSHPKGEAGYSFAPLMTKLRDRGYCDVNGWTFHTLNEQAAEGVYRSMWAKYQARSEEEVAADTRKEKPPLVRLKPPVELHDLRSVAAPPVYPPMQVQVHEQVPVQVPIVVPPTTIEPVREPDVEIGPPIPLRSNAPSTGTGADPLTGLVFDTPPDAAKVISKGNGDVDEPQRTRRDNGGARWG